MLSAPSLSIGRSQYALLGKLLFQTKPELAKELLTPYLKATDTETDYSKIRIFFFNFCKLTSIDPDENLGPLYKSDKVLKRKIFIAVILHLYHPEVFQQPTDRIIINSGIAKSLVDLFQRLDKGNLSRTIREVIVQFKTYDDFKSDVEEILEKIKSSVP